MPDIYVSTDVETDGPIPGPHSMLSFGSAAFSADGRLMGSFAANLDLLEGAAGAPETMAWWADNPGAWQATRSDCIAPQRAMQQYRDWLLQLPGRPLFVGYPAAFDFMFVQWYLVRFTGSSPFGHAAIDIRSYAMGALRCDFAATAKRRLPTGWTADDAHAHVALDDALAQGQLFCRMLAGP